VAWIASITAFDLWKFKSRGRSTTIAGTLILGVCTLLLILRHAFQGLEFWLAVLVLLFSFETVVYLRQASVRSQFESKPGQEGDS
jgi:Mn2+/Fe2+ NRAMP family transporter